METRSNLSVPIIDDDEIESHAETVRLSISVMGGAYGASLGRLNKVSLKILDYMDGADIVSDSFGLDSGSTNNTMGWSVVGNGMNPAWIDANGLYSVDQLFGEEEYSAECDFAATTPCGFSCQNGGGYGGAHGNGSGFADGVLQLESGGFVSTSTRTSAEFSPSKELTVAMWIRSSSSDGGTLLSYEVPISEATLAGRGAHELALHDHTQLKLLIRGRISSTRDMSLDTGLSLNDGEWHHVAVTWRSAGGEVVVYDNGEIKFSGGPYRAGLSLLPGGAFLVGRTPTVNSPCFSTLPTCKFETGTALHGQVQNIRVWSSVRSQRQIHLGMQWPFTALRLNLVLYWHFDSYNSDLNRSVVDRGEDGDDFTASLSATGTSIVSGSPSITSTYPCGDVHFNVWHFNAPRRLVSRLKKSYDGRLQFKTLSASFSGVPRAARGSIELRDSSGNRFSYSLASSGTTRRNEWIGHSVIMRESFGWVKEPSGKPADFTEFYSALQNASELLIRGDQWVYSRSGYGQEAVYINNVSLWSPNRGFN